MTLKNRYVYLRVAEYFNVGHVLACDLLSGGIGNIEMRVDGLMPVCINNSDKLNE